MSQSILYQIVFEKQCVLVLMTEFESKQRQLQTAVNELNQKSNTHLPTSK